MYKINLYGIHEANIYLVSSVLAFLLCDRGKVSFKMDYTKIHGILRRSASSLPCHWHGQCKDFSLLTIVMHWSEREIFCIFFWSVIFFGFIIPPSTLRVNLTWPEVYNWNDAISKISYMWTGQSGYYHQQLREENRRVEVMCLSWGVIWGCICFVEHFSLNRSL